MQWAMIFENKVKAICVKPIFLAWGCVQNQTVETVLGLDVLGETNDTNVFGIFLGVF